MNFGARFDWYEMTFDGHDDGRERSALALALGAELRQLKGRNGYAEAWAVVRDGDELARVYGHSSRPGEVHIVATSESCDEVVPVLRRLWPVHRVSRADSSIDFQADFAEQDELALAFAVNAGISFQLITNSAGGATRYLGSRSSENFVRVYKKSEQLVALHPERADSITAGVVRFELESRPSKREVKERAATMSPDDLWGLGQWTQAFALERLGIDAPRVSTHFRKPTDFERTRFHMKKQYSPTWSRRVAEVGLEVAQLEALETLGLGA